MYKTSNICDLRQQKWPLGGLNGILGKYPDSKVHGANMGSTWVPSTPDGPHAGPMNLAIRVNLHLMVGGKGIAYEIALRW